MGGRSRSRLLLEHFGKEFSFVKDLSDERLEKYGRYTSAAYQNADESPVTQTGKPSNISALNRALVLEHRERHDSFPKWDLKYNFGDYYRQQTLDKAKK